MNRSQASRRAARAALFVALLSTLLPALVSARDAEIDQQVRRLKALHQQILLGGAGRKIDAMRRAAALRRGRKPMTLRSAPPRDHLEAIGPQGMAGVARGLVPSDEIAPPTNWPLSPASPAFTTQSEVSIAGTGRFLVAAWNDGAAGGPGINGLSFSSSTDGGRSWIQGGALPLGGGVGAWTSDPVVTVDAKRQVFYVAGLAISTTPSNALGVIRGRFGASGFAWETPSLVRAVRDSFPDKPWLAADSLSGNLYVSYTMFFKRQSKNSDFIQVQRSEDENQTWSAALKVSPDAEDGLVQGSRPAIGPAGEVHVVWKTIDTTAAAGGLDAMRTCRSTDGGQSFGPVATVATLYTNFCSGPPGFDRGFGLGFPSIAVDRSTGPHRGRVHVAWEESLDFYDDRIAATDEVPEVEPNNRVRDATPFTIGETLDGEISPSFDADWFRFHGEQGQTAIVYVDSLDRRLDVALRLWCTDGQTRLAYSAAVNVRQRIIVFTLPKTADYYVSLDPHNDSTGAYRISTAWAHRGLERGRDQRDIFVAHSDDGVNWSTPVLASDDPPGFDDWLPELAVSGDGKPFVAWYDYRDGDPANCGAGASVRLARSDDGGDHWMPVGVVTEVPTLWSAVSSNLSPNMGDYIGLLADEHGVYPSWADGRSSDPDVYASFWPSPSAAQSIVAIGAEPQSGGFLLRWHAPPEMPLSATLYRRASGIPETALGELDSDPQGDLAWLDVDLEPGYRYHYELSVRGAEGETRVGAVSIDVPDAGPAALAIEQLAPNPSAGGFRVRFRRRDLTPARLEILDLSGRRVFALYLGPEYGVRGVVDVGRTAPLRPGLYVVRVAQTGGSATAKAVVVR